MNCREFERQLWHFQADELPEPVRDRFRKHMETCPGCARRLEVEQSLLLGLKSRLRREPAPPGLAARCRQALEREAPSPATVGWFRGPALAAMAAALLLAMIILPRTLSPDTGNAERSVAVSAAVERTVTVVDFECDRKGVPLGAQRACAHPTHLNALKIAGDGYWHVSLADTASRRLATDRDLRGHRLHVRGQAYEEIRTLQVSDFRDLGIIQSAALHR